MCAPNSIEFVVTWYRGRLASAAVVATVNPQLTEEEIIPSAAAVGSRWLVTTTELFAAKLRGAGEGGWDRGDDRDRRPAPECGNVLLAVASAPAQAGPVSAATVEPRTIRRSCLLERDHGLPKVVVLTHRNLVASLGQTGPCTGDRGRRGDRGAAAVPHFGLQVSLNLSLAAGATVVIRRASSRRTFLRAIRSTG